MYVGITRARHDLMVSALKRRKRGRETVAGAAEPVHRRDEARRGQQREDPREQLKALRAELASRGATLIAPAT